MTLFSLHTFQGESEKADCPSKQRERRPKEKNGIIVDGTKLTVKFKGMPAASTGLLV